MQIKIAERLRPFSQTPGTYCILPGTVLRLQIFPALLLVHEVTGVKPKLIAEIPVPVKGPVKGFTVQLDLEKGAIHVWGEGLQGYFRYRILRGKDPLQLVLRVEKGLSNWNQQDLQQNLQIHSTERLSLGNHKSQDWEMVKRREDLTEILPVWLRLGQLTTSPQDLSYEGTAALLKVCKEASKMEVYEAFIHVFKTAFDGILSPRLVDDQHQGFEFSLASEKLSPLILLTEGAKIIRSLFIRSEGNDIHILPRLPPQFHCGRFLQAQCDSLGRVDFEWTKKMMRRMVFYAESTGIIKLHFPKDIEQFRLDGQFIQVGQPIEVEQGRRYIFDRFQK